jgi:hypothetical protein
MLENRAEQLESGTRFVRRFFVVQDSLTKKETLPRTRQIFHIIQSLAIAQNTTLQNTGQKNVFDY